MLGQGTGKSAPGPKLAHSVRAKRGGCSWAALHPHYPPPAPYFRRRLTAPPHSWPAHPRKPPDGDVRGRAVNRLPPHGSRPDGKSRHRCRHDSPRNKLLPRHHADTVSCHSPFPLRRPGRGLHTACSLGWTPGRAAPAESSIHFVIACAVRDCAFARGAGWVEVYALLNQCPRLLIYEFRIIRSGAQCLLLLHSISARPASVSKNGQWKPPQWAQCGCFTGRYDCLRLMVQSAPRPRIRIIPP